jgi:COP9 signalosome complex subunit 3
MSAELASLLLSFQPDDPELKQKRDYDTSARNFVQQVAAIADQHFLKGANTPQDILEVITSWIRNRPH